MAKGLDQLEGEAVEILGFLLLVLLAVVVFTAWKGAGSLGSLSGVAASVIKKIWNAIDSVFSKSVSALESGEPSGGLGQAQVYTGSTLGTSAAASSTTDTASADDDTADYNSPSSAGDELSQYDPQYSYDE